MSAGISVDSIATFYLVHFLTFPRLLYFLYFHLRNVGRTTALRLCSFANNKLYAVSRYTHLAPDKSHYTRHKLRSSWSFSFCQSTLWWVRVCSLYPFTYLAPLTRIVLGNYWLQMWTNHSYYILYLTDRLSNELCTEKAPSLITAGLSLLLIN